MKNTIDSVIVDWTGLRRESVILKLGPWKLPRLEELKMGKKIRTDYLKTLDNIKRCFIYIIKCQKEKGELSRSI